MSLNHFLASNSKSWTNTKKAGELDEVTCVRAVAAPCKHGGWEERHKAELAQLPKACWPQTNAHGEWSWTLTGPSSGAKIEVLMRHKAFYVRPSSVEWTLSLRQIRFDFRGSTEATWRYVAKAAGYE